MEVSEDSPIDEHIKLPTFVDAAIMMTKITREERSSMNKFSRWTKIYPNPIGLTHNVPNIVDKSDIWSCAISCLDYTI